MSHPISAIKKYGVALSLAVSTFISSTHACTLAFWNNNDQAKVAARTMDLYISDKPQMVVFPRGIERDGAVGEHSLKWRSKYGSVVMTAFHTPAASEGMNEAGFGAHLLYLDKTQYETRDPSRLGLANVLWAQYLLDNCKTVKQAIALSKNFQLVSIKVHGREWPLHLAVEDKSGDSALFEYINGKMVIHHGHQYNVMTNEPAYDTQLANLKRYKLFGGTLPMPGDVDPLSRFVRASSYLKTLPYPEDRLQAIEGVLSVIRTTMVPFGAENTSGNATEDAWATRWVTVQDLTHGTYFFNSTTAPNVIWLNLKDVSLNPDSPALMIDPTNINLVGDISKQLVPYHS